MKTAVVILAFAISAFAQQPPPSAGLHVACGSLGATFKTATSAAQPPSQPETGQALVYVVEDFPKFGEAIGAPTIKVGLDGNWVGATHGASYLFFTVDPGEHHLCINWQSSLGRLSKLVSFARLMAEPGKTYYFRSRAIYSSYASNMYLDLDAIDPDEGEYLVASSQLSSERAKK
jgi:hypothetical protein